MKKLLQTLLSDECQGFDAKDLVADLVKAIKKGIILQQATKQLEQAKKI